MDYLGSLIGLSFFLLLPLIYLLILGFTYGREEGMSPTHKEYEEARLEIADKDCILIYVKNDEDTVQKRDRRLRKWIEDRRDTHTCKPFKNVEKLKEFVENRLRHLWQEKFEKNDSCCSNPREFKKRMERLL